LRWYMLEVDLDT